MVFDSAINAERKAKTSANSKLYRQRPEVIARRKLQRIKDNEARRERKASESESDYQDRRAKEREHERAAESRKNDQELAKKRAYFCAWKKNRSPEQHRRDLDLERERRYGVTTEFIDEMRILQNGKCALCSYTLDRTRGFNGEHVDHCHETGRVRGLLCGACNGALGKLGDNVASIQRVLEYLKAETGHVFKEPIERRRRRRNGKLNADLVQEIHGRAEHGESQVSIAQRLGINQATVSNVRTGRLWKDSR